MDGILAAAGNSVSRLFANLFNLSAIETVQLESLTQKRRPIRAGALSISIMPGCDRKTGTLFDEFRSNAQGTKFPVD